MEKSHLPISPSPGGRSSSPKNQTDLLGSLNIQHLIIIKSYIFPRKYE